jgi:tripartite-type tricarboxylate transporter receptor subunit TctC
MRLLPSPPSRSPSLAGLFLGLVAALALPLAARGQSADPAASYPNQTVRIIVPFSAGSNTDGQARVIADKLGELWRQQVIVENRPGMAGTNSAAKATPDGYNLLLTSSGHSISGVLHKNLSFDPIKDFTAVTQVTTVPVALIVSPDLPAKTAKEFIELAVAKPGTLNFSSAGTASTSYLAGELFKQTAKINIVHIPYKGGPEAMTAVIRGDAQLYMSSVNLALDLLQAGRVRALAVTTAARVAPLPDVPTVAESGLPDYFYDSWFGVLAPAHTPPSVVEKISRDIAHVLDLPDVQDRLTKLGMVVSTSGPAKFDELVRKDTERFGKLLRDAGIGAE